MTQPTLRSLTRRLPVVWRMLRELKLSAKRGERELYLLPFLVDPSRLAVDVGANTGLYTHALLRLGARVASIEANPNCGRILSALYGERITLFPIAVSNQTGTAQLRFPSRSKESGLSTIEPVDSLGGTETLETEVPVRRIDDLCLSNVGFMKIDVEGHELSVLKGAKALLIRDRPTLLIEAEDRHRPGAVASVRDFLYSLGYVGMLCDNGRLRTLDATQVSDLQNLEHHDLVALNRGHLPRRYINNFVFLPSTPADHANP